MAERRMFSKRITSSAKFLMMPSSSQLLYFHLGMNADDDGVVEAYTVMLQCKASEGDLAMLLDRGFAELLDPSNRIIYLTDWPENNRIRADRKVNSIYLHLLLEVHPELRFKQAKPRADTGKKKRGRPTDNQWTPQDRLGKGSLGKGNKTYEQENLLEVNPEFQNDQNQESKPKNSELESQFEALWALYPNKKGKEKARTAFTRAIKHGSTFDEMKKGIELYCQEIQAKHTSRDYIKHGDTWFRNKCWSDDYDTTPATGKGQNRESLPDWSQPGYKQEHKPVDPEEAAAVKAHLAKLKEQQNEV
jgi:hypothetical protein